MRIAVFSVRATVDQSAHWKRAAEAEGFASVGAWAAPALDSYLELQARAGRPLPLAWSRRQRFRVRLLDGSEPELPGWAAPPFGIFRGDATGPGSMGCKLYTLAYLSIRRLLATFRHASSCRAFAAELARVWVRWDGQGSEPPSQIRNRS
jgi:hypothetical protein